MTAEQEELIKEKQEFCRKNIPILKTEEVHKICVEFDFDMDKINEYFRCYEIEDKYKDVPAY